MTPDSTAPSLLRHTVPIASASMAREVMGPLHSHIQQVQERFRDRSSPRGKPRYLVHLDAQGDGVALSAAAEAEQAFRQAIRVIETLVARAQDTGTVLLDDVLAAIRHAAPDEDAAAGLSPPPRGPVKLPTFAGLTLRTPKQVHYVEALRDAGVDLIFGVGPAGTGKTFLAVAAAVEALKSRQVERIVVTRPAVEAGEKLGYLPGDLAEKVDPYLQPIWDAFRGHMSEIDLKARRERKEIEVAPLAFMRGRTLTRAFVICDEAQNTTSLQMRMVLTRLGQGSRMVVTGDPSQVDLPRSEMSGLVHALSIIEGTEGVEVIRFAAQDVVRHKLVAKIIEAYDRDDARRMGREA